MRIPFWGVIIAAVISCFVGCGAFSTKLPVEPDFYPYGAKYERVLETLSMSEAHVRLDDDQDPEWYDKSTKQWVKLARIDDVKLHLHSTKAKNFVVIFRRNSAMNSLDANACTISEYSRECGFEFTIVVDYRSKGLHVTHVIPRF